MKNEEFKKIPGVDTILDWEKCQKLSNQFGLDLVTFAVRSVIEELRSNITNGGKVWNQTRIYQRILSVVHSIGENSLKPVINATGIVLHTNLGRAPLGEDVLKEIAPIIKGYSNVEFDLEIGKRGQRNDHISNIIKFVTGAEDAAVVNNNAAGIFLSLKTFAEGKEVIISRGELIEIGGSFRIPEIMVTSGAKMVEVGTTNRTRISDYEKAITENTKVIFKAHKSNYFISGFTEEASVMELSKLAKKHNLIFIYDIGSGLLRRPKNLKLENEPDIRSCLKQGADIVCFSGDKLLGGPQAGIIVGKKKYISKLAKSPLMRVLRTGKLTLAALSTVIRYYLREEDLFSKIKLFQILTTSQNEIESRAIKLKNKFENHNIKSEIAKSRAQCGGGTLPYKKIDSFSVKLCFESDNDKSPEKIFFALLKLEKPIVAILREGNLHFDVLTFNNDEIDYVASQVGKI
ncbi:MAG: L-seryl-tRNA(Sec) selenium transferase, partial [Candidatus Cloacimonadota bacterium]|nr:L-seryl-tRNA(Sec) selenium transferase [Candidatus Cloacimonadota bacterium]